MTERISDAEQAVMEVLWTAAPLAAQDVADKLAVTQSWSLPTVKTMLSRLVSKGAIHAEADGRKFLYSPAIERSTWINGESKRFVDRLFGGKLSPLVAQFAEAEALSVEDIAEIEGLLKALRA